MRETTRPRLSVVATAVLFSTGGAAIKASSLGGPQVSCLRTAVAALAVLALVPAARRLPSWREWLVGGAYTGSLVFYTLANKLTTAASTIFLQSTAPLYILVLGPWLLRERIDRRDLAFLAAAGVGLSMFFLGAGPPQATAPDPFLGNLLGLAAGLCWAFTLVGLRWLGSSGENASAVLAGNVIATLVCIGSIVPFPDVAFADWAVILWLGVFQVALAYMLLTAALKRMPAFEASLLLLLEPVLNPVWAWIAHGESPGRWALLGGGIVLGATVVHDRLEARSRAAEARAARGPTAPGRS